MAKVKPKWTINIPKNLADTYFFILWSLFAVILFSASMAATEFNILNPGNKVAITNFYTQLHYFIILVVFFLCASAFFRFLQKWGLGARFLFILYNILAIIILGWGVYAYIIL